MRGDIELAENLPDFIRSGPVLRPSWCHEDSITIPFTLRGDTKSEEPARPSIPPHFVSTAGLGPRALTGWPTGERTCSSF